MRYFLDTVGSIPDGLGFSHYDIVHFSWLAFGVLLIIAGVLVVMYVQLELFRWLKARRMKVKTGE